MLATASGHVADIDPANVRGDGSSVSIAPGARARYAAELLERALAPRKWHVILHDWEAHRVSDEQLSLSRGGGVARGR